MPTVTALRIVFDKNVPDHGYLRIAIPPMIGFLKGKSPMPSHGFPESRGVSGEHFGLAGYAVSTVGFDLDQVW